MTLTRAVNNVLLPIAAVNFGFEKAKRYFESRFAKDLEEKTADIPAEELVEPKASIAGPALQGLAFTHEEPDLKAMYLSLLSTAMDKRKNGNAHPAFVELIKQIDPNEVGWLRPLLTSPVRQSIVEIRLQNNDQSGYMSLRPHYMEFLAGAEGKEVEVQNFTAMLENWVRLGLVDVDYTQYVTAPGAYDWVEKREYVRGLRKFHDNDTRTIVFQRGIVGRTSFGAQFASAVGMYAALPTASVNSPAAVEE
ncbi:uncharacterized protein DUF4393 [Paraburkholderia sp. BL23I1N1]|uniref:DUF4393 domain-containing protein n=1 Tax=Paraburkholderia sp. BL23I1N1 TaxID=1938802 RepID=UPI000FF5715C|nr:DUF4393 domain-containing protein [Paraburkholderia sp. BL23I1N1]RKE24374.1 uncharacterized protein DUF4393 [Paraburkholderia sp. BL23I1N1]